MELKFACGCPVNLPGGLGIVNTDMCPLHTAASQMLGALKVTHEYNVHIAECPDTVCAKCDDLFNRMLELVPKAIAKAEGRNG